MSVDEWVSKEHLLYDQLPTLFLTAGVLFFVIVFIYLYVEKRRCAIPFLLGFVLIGGWIFFIIKQNEPVFEQNAVSSPAIRDRKKNFYYYEKFDRAYLSNSDKDKLEKLKFVYKERKFTDSEDQVAYLGSDEKKIYFQVNGQSVYCDKDSPFAVFSKEEEQPKLVYVTFELKNPDFKKVEFYDELGKFPVKLLIPISLEN